MSAKLQIMIWIIYVNFKFSEPVLIHGKNHNTDFCRISLVLSMNYTYFFYKKPVYKNLELGILK